jgi:hypothetical protein
MNEFGLLNVRLIVSLKVNQFLDEIFGLAEEEFVAFY